MSWPKSSVILWNVKVNVPVLPGLGETHKMNVKVNVPVLPGLGETHKMNVKVSVPTVQ